MAARGSRPASRRPPPGSPVPARRARWSARCRRRQSSAAPGHRPHIEARGCPSRGGSRKEPVKMNPSSASVFPVAVSRISFSMGKVPGSPSRLTLKTTGGPSAQNRNPAGSTGAPGFRPMNSSARCTSLGFAIRPQQRFIAMAARLVDQEELGELSAAQARCTPPAVRPGESCDRPAIPAGRAFRGCPRGPSGWPHAGLAPAAAPAGFGTTPARLSGAARQPASTRTMFSNRLISAVPSPPSSALQSRDPSARRDDTPRSPCPSRSARRRGRPGCWFPSSGA